MKRNAKKTVVKRAGNKSPIAKGEPEKMPVASNPAKVGKVVEGTPFANTEVEGWEVREIYKWELNWHSSWGKPTKKFKKCLKRLWKKGVVVFEHDDSYKGVLTRKQLASMCSADGDNYGFTAPDMKGDHIFVVFCPEVLGSRKCVVSM